tara:strand:- start:42864 stop:43148 length:285 start_codon:yes stop_codon:yes gene_type:complete
MHLLPSVLLAACLATACATTPQDPGTIVIYLQHTKADTMAETVGQFLAEARADGASYPTIHAHADSNSLMLEGDQDNVQKVIKLIQNLDVERQK